MRPWASLVDDLVGSSNVNRRKMRKTATLEWRPAVSLRITRNGTIAFDGEIEAVPTTPGMYIFACRRHGRIEPMYIGLAGRSIRRRLKEHLRSSRMFDGLDAARPGKRLFIYATLEPNDAAARRYLGSFERALIRRATEAGCAALNIHQKQRTKYTLKTRCTFYNEGHREILWWCPRKVSTALMPERRAARTA
jgi:hypothetical protein